eukprot:TRINITY_DN24726_c0_g1_i1.p1 TRINITY_DN24726_c0_g1~~TRINITY_DN24726_c0_g1_i1.p1  ORF type:complete len:437 (+),score=207.64 TRINITY_DN24726_c0_g1_i1:85-1395(+)
MSDMSEMEFAKNVGYAFIREYYNGNSRDPALLGHMYSKESTYMRWVDGEAIHSIGAFGVEDIRQQLEAQTKCKYQLKYVDCTPSYKGSILITVGGKMLYLEGINKEFHQTFIISPNATSPDTYYIHNDMMRTFVEEAPQYVAEPAPVVAPTPPPPSPPAPVAEPAPVYEEPVEQLPAEEEQVQEAEQVEEMVAEIVDEPEPEPEQVIEEPVQEVAEPEPEPVVEQVPEPVVEQEVVEEKAEPVAEPEPEVVEEVKPSAPKSWAALAATKSKAAAAPVQLVRAPTEKRETGNKIVDTTERKKGGDRGGLGIEKYFPAGGKGAKGAKGGKGGKKDGETRSREFSHGGSLYVRNLPKEFSDEDCEKVFGVFGKLSGKTIKAADGYAFVDFETRGAMEKALEKAQEKPISFAGQALNVQEKTKQPRKGDKDVRNTRRERN